MKRSVIQLAGKTLVCSLPKEWADANHIKKGQELEVTPSGDRLVISGHGTPSRKEVYLGEKDAPWFGAYILSFLYQLGIDEVTIRYSSVGTASMLAQKCAQLLGFEIVEHTANKVTVRNVANTMDHERTVLVRRSFFVINEMGRMVLEQGAHPQVQLQTELQALDGTLNKLTDYCKRAINSSTPSSALIVSTHYTLIRDLEKIGDQYRNLGNACTRAVPSSMRTMLTETNALFDLLYHLYYEFSHEYAGEFHTRSRALKEKIRAQMRLAKNGRYALEMHCLCSLIELIIDVFGPVYMMWLSHELEKKNPLVGSAI